MSIQRLIFPMKYLNLSQKELGKYSHHNINAIDGKGKDYKIDNVFAPCDIKIVAVYRYNSMGNCVIATSLNKVRFADGTINYATFQFMHDNNISNIKVGKIIKQRQVFYQEGTSGFATGNHIHLAVKKGLFDGFDKNNWSLKGAINTQKVFFVLKGYTVVMNTLGNKYKETSSLIYNKPAIKKWSKKRKYKSKVNGLYVRLQPNAKTGKIYRKLNKKSKPINYFGEITTNGYTWYVYKNIKGQNAYTVAKHLTKV